MHGKETELAAGVKAGCVHLCRVTGNTVLQVTEMEFHEELVAWLRSHVIQENAVLNALSQHTVATQKDYRLPT